MNCVSLLMHNKIIFYRHHTFARRCFRPFKGKIARPDQKHGAPKLSHMGEIFEGQCVRVGGCGKVKLNRKVEYLFAGLFSVHTFWYILEFMQLFAGR